MKPFAIVPVLSGRFLATRNESLKSTVRRFCTQPPNIPKSSTTGVTVASNYATQWKLDRAFSWALVAILPLGLAYPCKLMDTLMALGVVGHSQLALLSVLKDYIRTKSIRGYASKASYVVSVLVLAGLMQLTFADIGIANTIRKVWEVKPKHFKYVK